MDVRFVEWGVANNFGDYIEIHKDLPKFSHLYKPILKHELKHSDKTFSYHDLKMDVTPTGVSWIKLIGFMITRPKTWIQLLPIYWQRRKGWIMDINMIIIYIVTLFILGGLVWLL